MNLDFSPEDVAFREEARSFIAENYPQILRDKAARNEDLTKEDKAGSEARVEDK